MSRFAIYSLVALALAGAPLARAEAPSAFPEFSAKRVVPPGKSGLPGSKPANRRITVQIDPEEQARVLAARPLPQPAAPEGAAPAGPLGKYAWFWDQVSPELTSAGAGRLAPALTAIGSQGKVAVPRLQSLQDIARSQGVPILRNTVGTRVSPALVLAVIAVESAGRADAVSHAGAAGLMQLMPATAERFGVADRMIAEENIKGGVRYLDWLMGEFGNDPILVLAGYNAGEGSVRTHNGVPPFAETRDYVPKVLAAFQLASGLCQTPPQLISDGCVFVAMN